MSNSRHPAQEEENQNTIPRPKWTHCNYHYYFSDEAVRNASVIHGYHHETQQKGLYFIYNLPTIIEDITANALLKQMRNYWSSRLTSGCVKNVKIAYSSKDQCLRFFLPTEDVAQAFSMTFDIIREYRAAGHKTQLYSMNEEQSAALTSALQVSWDAFLQAEKNMEIPNTPNDYQPFFSSEEVDPLSAAEINFEYAIAGNQAYPLQTQSTSTHHQILKRLSDNTPDLSPKRKVSRHTENTDKNMTLTQVLQTKEISRHLYNLFTDDDGENYGYYFSSLSINDSATTFNLNMINKELKAAFNVYIPINTLDFPILLTKMTKHWELIQAHLNKHDIYYLNSVHLHGDTNTNRVTFTVPFNRPAHAIMLVNIALFGLYKASASKSMAAFNAADLNAAVVACWNRSQPDMSIPTASLDETRPKNNFSTATNDIYSSQPQSPILFPSADPGSALLKPDDLELFNNFYQARNVL